MKLLRLAEMPKVENRLLVLPGDPTTFWGGVGERPIWRPVRHPGVAQRVFAGQPANGRMRTLPLKNVVKLVLAAGRRQRRPWAFAMRWISRIRFSFAALAKNLTRGVANFLAGNFSANFRARGPRFFLAGPRIRAVEKKRGKEKPGLLTHEKKKKRARFGLPVRRNRNRMDV